MSKHPQKDSIRMKIVYPGKHIGIIEEGTPGKNTYEVDGNIYSSVIGRLNYDKDNREFRVRPFKEPNYVSAGYVILGTISATGLTSAKVEIEAIYRPKIKILGKPLEGYIFKRKESNWMFAVTDIILAKVLRIVDIAPTILHMFNVPIPRDMDGRVLKEILLPLIILVI